jgi:hypothetical protein
VTGVRAPSDRGQWEGTSPPSREPAHSKQTKRESGWGGRYNLDVNRPSGRSLAGILVLAAVIGALAAALVDIAIMTSITSRFNPSLTTVAAACWGTFFGVGGLMTLILWRVTDRKTDDGRCANCGYDLRATPDAAGPRLATCPECGAAAA